jgi:hypothetical protein
MECWVFLVQRTQFRCALPYLWLNVSSMKITSIEFRNYKAFKHYSRLAANEPPRPNNLKIEDRRFKILSVALRGQGRRGRYCNWSQRTRLGYEVSQMSWRCR